MSSDNNLTTGLHEKVLTTSDDEKILYTFVVPENISNEPLPLILALHYGGKNCDYYSRPFIEQFLPAYSSLNALIIAPDCPGENWRDAKSEKAVLALLKWAFEHLPIDQKRVVVSGYSMGGIGTWFMSTRHPELFCAAIPISAKPLDEPDGSIPFYVIHSEIDELFDISLTEDAVQKLQQKGGCVELQIINDITHYESEKFVAPLTKAVQWLKELLNRDKQG